MKAGRLFHTRTFSGVFRLKVLGLCFFFALGILLGGMIHSVVANGADQQLRDYLMQFAKITAQSEDMPGAAVSVLVTYFRYPVLLFLCGFMAAGIVLIPTLCVVQGFFLSFAVHCFASALGRSGVMLALSAFGVRCLFTLPCTLFLAMYALSASVQLVQVRTGGRRKERMTRDRAYVWRFAICAIVLLVGVIVELSVVPKLLLFALADIT